MVELYRDAEVDRLVEAMCGKLEESPDPAAYVCAQGEGNERLWAVLTINWLALVDRTGCLVEREV